MISNKKLENTSIKPDFFKSPTK